MKKKSLIISTIGLVIQCFGLGFMLYGINNNEKFTWIGFGIISVGFMLIGIGLIMFGLNKT